MTDRSTQAAPANPAPPDPGESMDADQFYPGDERNSPSAPQAPANHVDGEHL